MSISIDSRTLARIRIVLMQPSHPGNIGGAARAMKTMGVSDLRIVRPERYPDPQAEWRAAGALDVLDAARVESDLDAAIGDCGLVIGTSTRNRRIPWPVSAPREAAETICAEPGDTPIAILFGREISGLTNEELQRCRLHLQIDANPDYASLNLAMAVQVVCYEIRMACLGTLDGDRNWDREAATDRDLEGLFGHLETVLDELNYFDPANPGKVMTRFRRLFMRQRLDETEVKMLRGLLSHIQHKPSV
jgi:tRNA (cytidine32/uridine32-2'-O)-methyltransferase